MAILIEILTEKRDGSAAPNKQVVSVDKARSVIDRLGSDTLVRGVKIVHNEVLEDKKFRADEQDSATLFLGSIVDYNDLLVKFTAGEDVDDDWATYQEKYAEVISND